MAQLTDLIGNVLKEGQLVRCELTGGGAVLGRIAKIDQGSMNPLYVQGATTPAVATVEVVCSIPTVAKPGSSVRGLIVIQEPKGEVTQ